MWPPGSGSAKAGCVQSLLAYALGSKPIVLQQGGGERGGAAPDSKSPDAKKAA